ncbi:ubiquitin carboxyl-terminal hydrolase CYLD [Astatotilapia calliptera]|uniref:ubiquitin carboxyl-terminal hydrolase CYLD n=1 Tax=Astatotilapia calliptera TaxID=8154 RepID=UPI000E414A22|nr:ubiquitin carboxyl-terminal hydrolase CYLD-like [Astatotilapia calliptera]XP_026002808.1 ubiquitin carboxyl-terminal hydrolase CYLD-like [Astatotilapia calliptera]
MASTENVYFILTKKPERISFAKAGSIVYMPENKYISEMKKSPPPLKLRMCLMNYSRIDYDLEANDMEQLCVEEVELLQALPDEAERLRCFRERHDLQAAMQLAIGTEVTVEEAGKKLRGIIHYIGPLKKASISCPIPGYFFGIELQGPDRGKGYWDGTYGGERYFKCDKNCGVFTPFNRVSSLLPPVHKPSLQSERLELGDRVTCFIDDKFRYGMVLDLLEIGGQCFVQISTDKDESGKTGGEVRVPLEAVIKGELIAEGESMDVDTPPEADTDYLYMGLSLNSMVEVTLGEGNTYGIIRWIGKLPDRSETMVGLELDENKGVSDGTFKGQRYFKCPVKRALFVKLSSCRPDSRFQSTSSNHNEKMQPEDTVDQTDHSTAELQTVPPMSTEQVKQLLTGRMKGIQGHCNSCYMDAALFSLFSCSSVLDSMLFKSTTPQDAPIQRTLLNDIVNPLRSNGFVEGRHIMKLRQQLQKHGYSQSFTTDEKDPEEFLSVIMHHILALDPLLKLSAAGKVQESYCYQIFLDQNHRLVLPTVQQLLEHSFHSAGLKLAEVPSCLILQMPRFGKKFKMFDKIIPSLELDVTDLLSEGPQQCMLCGTLAQVECVDCFKDPLFSPTGFKVFCEKCSKQVHSHPQRRSHKPASLEIPKGYVGRKNPHTMIRDKMELFAVLCIETSHYVSFVKYGPNTEDWIFFDSMADRQGEMDGYNIPEVQPCPEVGEYLEMSPSELANQAPRDMKGVAKRLFCDAYMYLYQSTTMCLYR